MSSVLPEENSITSEYNPNITNNNTFIDDIWKTTTINHKTYEHTYAIPMTGITQTVTAFNQTYTNQKKQEKYRKMV